MSDAGRSRLKHLVFVPISLRSHLRLLLQLIDRVVERCPTDVVVSLLVTSTIERVLNEELLRPKCYVNIGQAQRAHRLRVKVIEDGLPENSKVVDEKLAFKRLAGPVIKTLVKAESADWPSPQGFIGDVSRCSLYICAVPLMPREDVSYRIKAASTRSVRLRRQSKDPGPPLLADNGSRDA